MIPGGVYEPKELSASLEKDPALREHYKGVNVDSLIAVRTQSAMLAKVSYRKDGHISWTSKAIAIPAGEMVLTDGKQMIRSRCGNRIQMQTEATHREKSQINTEEASIVAALETPLPSIVPPLPPYQPVIPPGVKPADTGGPSDPVANTPEPAPMMMFASGLLLLVAGCKLRF